MTPGITTLLQWFSLPLDFSENASPLYRNMKDDKLTLSARGALRVLAERCPRLTGLCYWAGTASIAIEDLHHRQSFDLDFHTQRALQNTLPILAEIQHAFPDDFEVTQTPDAFGSGFQGVLTLPDGNRITIEVLANYEDVPDDELVTSRTAPAFKRIGLARYLADKIQCIAERSEARDLVDIRAVLRQSPAFEQRAREMLAQQDALLIAERLLSWSDEGIAGDLEAYPDVDPGDAREACDLLLSWLRESESGER